MREAAKDGHTRRENVATQPLKEHRVFNNPDVVTEGWYPVCKSSKLKPGKADSFLISHHRVAVWRSASGEVAAIDAFCPHMGADLGNGKVVDGCSSVISISGATVKPVPWRGALWRDAKNVANRAWPVEGKSMALFGSSRVRGPIPGA